MGLLILNFSPSINMKKLLTGSVMTLALLFGFGFADSAQALEKNLLTLEEAYAIANNIKSDETRLNRSQLRARFNRSKDRRRAANYIPPRKSKLSHGFNRRDDSDVVRFRNQTIKNFRTRETAARRSVNGFVNKFRVR